MMSPSVHLSDVMFRANRAGTSGGGMYADVNDGNNVTLVNTTLEENSASGMVRGAISHAPA